VSIQREAGWAPDSFGRHDTRWVFIGTPTTVLRHGDLEPDDEPPDEESSQDATADSGGSSTGGAGDPLDQRLHEAEPFGSP
jgi:hypothetical protein